MNKGQYISGAGHLALIGWVLIGEGLFRPTDPRMEVVTATFISEEDFSNLQDAAGPRAADEPAMIEPAEPEVQPDPEPTPPPEPDPEPVPVGEPEPPQTPAEPPIQPEAGSTVLDNQADDASVREADTVSDVETEAPEDVPTDVAPEPALRQDEAETAEIEAEPSDETQQEETTTEIVTEADNPGAGEGATDPVEPAPEVIAAPETSPRPRPRRDAVAEAQPEPEPETPAEPEVVEAPEPEPSLEDQIAAAAEEALQEALNNPDVTSETGGAGTAPSGPPLTGGEIDGFRLAVQRCWIVDPGSEAARVEVTVAFSLSQDGSISGVPRMLSANGGSDTAIGVAYEAARRAILRCGASGFDLPPEKYEQWREVEMTFDASGGRIR